MQPYLNRVYPLIKVKKLSSWVIRQKSESHNGCFKKTKHAEILEKLTFLNPWYAHVCVPIRGKKYSFLGKFGVLCFLETPVLRFSILPYYRRVMYRTPKVIRKLSIRVIFDNSRNSRVSISITPPWWLDRAASLILQNRSSYIRFIAIVILPFYGQFRATRKPDSRCMVCKTYIFINSNRFVYKN